MRKKGAEHVFAAAWRKQPKSVVSRKLKAVGLNATLVEGDLGAAIPNMKAEHQISPAPGRRFAL